MMALLFAGISTLLFVLYLREHSRNKKIENNYKYINARLLSIINDDETNYILIPSDQKVVKETAENINNLLEKFYRKQIDHNRNQKTILQLFTNISHDLRTPITVLKGYIEMLYLQSQKEELPPAIRATIEKMQSNSQELVHSVNNLFNLAKIQSGDMVFHIQKENLTQLCHEIILEFSTILEKENFDVMIHMEETPLYANVDIEAVERILKNLVDNAITYGNTGKFLGISLYKKDHYIAIEVEDHGAGISEKDKEHIFTRAYTADRKKGNGLGLAISQGLADAMGGSISVVSIPQKKTVFTLRLHR